MRHKVAGRRTMCGWSCRQATQLDVQPKSEIFFIFIFHHVEVCFFLTDLCLYLYSEEKILRRSLQALMSDNLGAASHLSMLFQFNGQPHNS